MVRSLWTSLGSLSVFSSALVNVFHIIFIAYSSNWSDYIVLVVTVVRFVHLVLAQQQRHQKTWWPFLTLSPSLDLIPKGKRMVLWGRYLTLIKWFS